MSGTQITPASLPARRTRRRHRRVSLRKAVHIVSPEESKSVWGHTANISESGIYLEATEAFPIGTEIALRMPTGLDRHVLLQGRVVRTAPVGGMGIEFLDLTDDALGYLQGIVNGGLAQLPSAKRAVTVWYEGQPQPIKSQAVFTAEGLSVSTKLPFLRQDSLVCFQLEGDDEAQSGVLEAVGLSVDPQDRVPRLSIRLALPRESGASEGSRPSESPRPAEVFEGRGGCLEEVLVDLARSRDESSRGEAPTLHEPDDEQVIRRGSEVPSALDEFADLADELSSFATERLDDLEGLDFAAEREVVGERTALAPESAPLPPAAASLESLCVAEELDQAQPCAEAAPGTELADQLSESVLSALDESTSIQYLSLRGTQITDAGLSVLATLPNLKHLDLTGTNVTDEGLARLAEALRSRDSRFPTTPPPDQGARSDERSAATSPAPSGPDEGDDHLADHPAELAPEGRSFEDEGELDRPRGRAGLIAAIALAFVVGLGVALAVPVLWQGDSEGDGERRGSAAPQEEQPATVAASTAPVEAPPPEAPEVASPPPPPPPPPIEPPPVETPTPADLEVRADLVRVVTEGIGHVLIIPMQGRMDELEEYRLLRPFGVAIDLPGATPRVPLGHYLPNEHGFARVIINRGVGGSELGTHVRVHFANRQEDYHVEVANGYLRVIIPN